MPPQAIPFGQVIEYIEDRLYLASYHTPPNENSPLPFQSAQRKSQSKKRGAAAPKPVQPVYFTVDDVVLYNAFHADFGPLHIGHLYRFAVHFHEVLGNPENKDRPVVLWTKTDSKSRANVACLVACYMVLIQSWPPHLALAPIAQADPPYMPFRDAGYSQADFVLTIQDIVYGVWKAKEEALCGLKEFSLEEYEKFERVDMGDFNWITPQFLAFASPQYKPLASIPQDSPEFATLPSSISEVYASRLPVPFRNVLTHFASRNIGLVVRLNSELYSSSYFTALGIHHIDMIFEDGTCPPLPLVRRFIKLAHDMIAKNKGIAVHCKAGLGRTGCLIGAYLIYRYGFTANEIIAFMRFMRPGMVVGPQQHWLHLNQGTFREWWFEDTIKEKLMMSAPTTPGKATSKHRLNTTSQTATPPNPNQSKRLALGEIDNNEASPCYADENLPAPTPGQPRKSHRKDSRHHPYARAVSGNLGVEGDMGTQSMRTKLKNASRRSQTNGENGDDRRPMASAASPKTPGRSPSHQSVSSSAAGTSNIHEDVENWVEGIANGKTPVNTKSGSGVLGVSKVRSSPRRLGERTDAKIRKASGRIGSAGTTTRVKTT
ncbi:cell division control protein 14 [Ophidiomyces ophidiicola]|uniref:Cell division control protein 14 n=1 Tax=Ophidiomyces ophidiicola TaxID=1387563 RepID=A0ACB8UWK5_9EURO|nr:cell division control protein 14 [Ophidiomyces ophidiicola]KAI1915119.1 cell division control protein 14 [Ophidiomyces ophidiicola]KAI1917842.1 cell division control protein 14 [Ophidiomyces ophidiicola]KAI1929951.1 cell division control protein 14 [Ophidiomyces ophidiicola]KAI1949159.1 cell division control protein 14 [Ophidiomyces ophidiicola]KAI1955237.1 cell division control protein 14 [Ophidiomyces ophidiicola]